MPKASLLTKKKPVKPKEMLNATQTVTKDKKEIKNNS